MTNPVKLELVWANTGGIEDPSDEKYKLGWVTEIPTFQNFNYVLNALDRAKLSYAERDVYPWQDFINYKEGARVARNGKLYFCINSHNSSLGDNPQDPEKDGTKSYWTNAPIYSSKADAYKSVTPNKGLTLDNINGEKLSNSLWEGSDQTIKSSVPAIALVTNDPLNKNLLIANVRGELVVTDLNETTEPDSRSLIPSEENKTYRIYSEGYRPKQADIEGTIPEAPSDGAQYLRQNKNWVRNSNSVNSKDYGLITGIVDSETDYGAL